MEVERSGAAHIASILAALGAMWLSDGLKVDAAELALLPLQALASSDSADAAFARCGIPASNLLLKYLHGPTVVAGIQPSRALLAITACSGALSGVDGIAVRDLLVRQCMLSASLRDMFEQTFSANPLNCCALECALELHRLSFLTPSAFSQLCRFQPAVSSTAVGACQDDARVFSCLDILLSITANAHDAAGFSLLAACAHAVGLASSSRPHLQQQLCCSVFLALFTVCIGCYIVIFMQESLLHEGGDAYALYNLVGWATSQNLTAGTSVRTCLLEHGIECVCACRLRLLILR